MKYKVALTLLALICTVDKNFAKVRLENFMLFTKAMHSVEILESTLWKNEKLTFAEKLFREITSSLICVAKTIVFTKFLSKRCE